MYTKILNYQKWERVEVTDDFKIMTNRAILSIKDEDKESFKNSIEYILKQSEYIIIWLIQHFRINIIQEVEQMNEQKYKDFIQWLLDQWELDTKEVQDRAMKLLQEVEQMSIYENPELLEVEMRLQIN